MAVFNALTDIALLALPFPMLYNTQLSRKQYVGPNAEDRRNFCVLTDGV